MAFQETFKALSDPTRRAILDQLKVGAKTAGEIGAAFSMTAATVSHHLSVLKGAGLVSDTRRGKYIYYELDLSVLDEITAWFAGLKGEREDEEKGERERDTVADRAAGSAADGGFGSLLAMGPGAGSEQLEL